MRKRKGLGVAPFCLPEPSLSDSVTHQELQDELARLRAAISLLASRLGNELGTADARRILELTAAPWERHEWATTARTHDPLTGRCTRCGSQAPAHVPTCIHFADAASQPQEPKQ